MMLDKNIAPSDTPKHLVIRLAFEQDHFALYASRGASNLYIQQNFSQKIRKQ